MKSFKQFIGESEGDWADWQLGNILSDKQCLIIEEALGTNPEFIIDTNSDEFKMLDSLTTSDTRKESTLGKWSNLTRYSPAPGLDIFFIQDYSESGKFYFALKPGDMEKIMRRGLADWRIEDIFREF